MISYYQFFCPDGLLEGYVLTSPDFGPVFISVNNGPACALELLFVEENHQPLLGVPPFQRALPPFQRAYHRWSSPIDGGVKVTLQGNPPNGARLYRWNFTSLNGQLHGNAPWEVG